MTDDLIEYLQNWYESKCDGKWEHAYGIRIDNLDNPGWVVEIDGEENRKYIEFSSKENDLNWIRISANQNEFRGYGDSKKLKKILGYVKEWLESSMNN